MFPKFLIKLSYLFTFIESNFVFGDKEQSLKGLLFLLFFFRAFLIVFEKREEADYFHDRSRSFISVDHGCRIVFRKRARASEGFD